MDKENETEDFRPDVRDKRILYELDFNGRATRAQLSKLVRISSPVIHYRITQMERRGVIRNYLLLVDLSKIHEYQMKICLQFRRFDKNVLKEILEFLKDKSYIKRTASCQGNYDMFITIGADSVEKLSTYKEEIYRKFDQYISTGELALILEVIGYRRDYLIGEKGSGHLLKVMETTGKIEFEDIDFKMLDALRSNGKISILEIAAKLKSTPGIISRRLHELEKNGVIIGCRLQLDYSKLGIVAHKVFIHTQNVSKKRIAELYAYCNEEPHVTHLEKVLGGWDYEIEFEFFSSDEFTKEFENLRARFSDIIKKIEVLRITQDHTFSYY